MKKYVRCDIETDPAIVETILIDIWCIPPPGLLITSNTWLLTNGSNMGIIQLIEYTIRKRKMTKPEDKTIAIGVCNYGSVKNIKDFQQLEHIELENHSCSFQDKDSVK
ncbi:unnamed protein product [Rotaria magnacalcarata]|uniref:TRPM SLOG domain-containing protein n=1 Tax=Rotaria magnacalcarata TaxID=392030 RepID=A0A816MQG4_9BILA|nr:unnamed protein product [Rotaria magnacalcarata]CAF2109654.1 unnamed protein product [Rotaria magnacalcarata]CAF4142777.1 unnamed protein product [Rotaria magnacalcarata]CAF4290171.1 unnamed protein product [Rotaria magnacalcarata]CAF4312128.1 unnamed protein product [Rotaria magnacalcarata]